jgi:hypothetical protein
VRIPRFTHRWALACGLACLALAVLAVSAPAAPTQEPSSTDARALAQERYYGSYGDPDTYGNQGQDLRSPDARDAGRPVAPATPQPAATPAPVAGSHGNGGIAPLPFILALAGAVIVGVGLSTAVHARRRVAA